LAVTVFFFFFFFLPRVTKTVAAVEFRRGGQAAATKATVVHPRPDRPNPAKSERTEMRRCANWLEETGVRQRLAQKLRRKMLNLKGFATAA